MCVFGWCARVGELRFSCVDVGCKSCRVTSWKGISHLLRISCDHRLLGAFLHLPQEHRMNMEQDELGCFHTHPTYEHLITCFLLVQLYPTWIAGTAMFQHVMDHDLGDAWRCSEFIFGGNMFRSGKEMKGLLIQGEFLGIVLNVTFFFVVFVCLIFDYCFYLHMKHYN